MELLHASNLGDKVITTPFTFITTANTIIFCQAHLIFVDPNTLNDFLTNIFYKRRPNIYGVHKWNIY
jgi:dTDP-4-amino-4,6-dideoxygalactose transaminase